MLVTNVTKPCHANEAGCGVMRWRARDSACGSLRRKVSDLRGQCSERLELRQEEFARRFLEKMPALEVVHDRVFHFREMECNASIMQMAIDGQRANCGQRQYEYRQYRALLYEVDMLRQLQPG